MIKRLILLALLLAVSVGTRAQVPGDTVNTFDGQSIYHSNEATGSVLQTVVTPFLYNGVPTGGCLGTGVSIAINSVDSSVYYCAPQSVPGGAGSWLKAVGSGGGGGATLQTNGTNNGLQSILNLQNSASFNGLTLTLANAGGTGNVQLGLTGTLNNTGLTNSSVTVNGQSCALGASCTIPFQVSGAGLASSVGLNFIASSTDAVGLHLAPSNPSTNQVRFEITGGSYTGNAATATALASTPSQCPGGQFATGIAASGNANCTTPGNVSASGSPAQYQTTVWASAIAITGVGPGTSGQCFISNGAAANPSYQNCPSGFINPMTTLGDMIVENATPAATRLGGPTSPNGVVQYLTDTPSAGAAALEVWTLPGVAVNNNSETTCATQTLNVLDRATAIFCSGTTTATFTLPVHTTTGFGSGFPFVLANNNSGVMTLSPTTDTIDNASLFANWADFLYSNSSGNWQTVQIPQFSAFPNCVDSAGNHLNFTTSTGAFSCGTSIPTVPLSGLAAQAANTVVMNATGGSAAPTAVAMPTSGTNGCAGATNALTYNTTTHALGCNTISVSSVSLSAITAATAGNTIANGDNGLQVWNWAAATNQAQMQFGETTASTGGTLGNQEIVNIVTLGGSTAVPLRVANSLTGSQTLPALYVNPTWNTTGVVDAGLLVNVSNTASGTGSLLLDLQLNAASEFSVDKAGKATAVNLVDTTPATHSVAVYEGSSSMVGVGPGTTGQVLRATTSADPVYIDFPDSKSVPFAICVNGTAATGGSTTTSVGGICRAGTNNKDAYIGPFTTSDSIVFKVHLPADWDTGTNPYLDVDLASTDATNGHTVILQESVECSKLDGSTTDDVAFNAARSLATVTLNGNANRTWNTTLQLNSTDMTGCAAPGVMWVKITRTTDTATNVELYQANVTIPRLLAVQAN